jgi:hypothetical protein
VNEWIGSSAFSAMILGVIFLGLMKLLIKVNKKHWGEERSAKFEVALELFEGDRLAAKNWLSTPCKALGNKRPLDTSLDDVKSVVVRLSRGAVT